ncbi:MAG TPA: DUF4249 domain-containing protein [Bacteroidia bacterium]|jgi:hypothetical protein|nr:DUF4249 domain-containing protein [Bacteroidia bacterium]
MSKNFKTYSFILIFSVILFSCRKTIKLKLPEYKEKMVVEASITTGEAAKVFLSYSVPFFGDFDLSQPTKAFVKGAFVTVSDGTIVDTLKELDPTQGYFYFGSKLLAQQGKTYYLTITVNGKSYYADTYINTPVRLDSIYFKPEKDSLGFIWAHMHEPPGLGNNYRWFAKRLNRGDLFYAAPFNSVFDDKFIDGKSFDFDYDRGIQPNQVQAYKDDPEAGYFKRGDTVVVKFCTIGRKEYVFWNSYYLNKSSNGNPFSSPSNIVNTIPGDDVLGGFFGYSPSYDTLAIPK